MSEGKRKQNRKAQSNFLVQGSILAIAGILVRIIGMLYRIPMYSILDYEGMGIYTNAFTIYSIILIISSYSLPLAVSKLVSARVEKREYRNAYRVFQGAMIFGMVSGLASSLIVYFGADVFTMLTKSQESAMAIKVLSPTLFIVAVMGVLRGYFQGLGTTIPTAISQLIEQVINAICSVVAAYVLMRNFDLSYGAAGGTLGTGLGALAGLLFLLFIYAIYKPRIKKQNRMDKSTYIESYSHISKLLALTIAPVLLSTTIYNVIDFLDTVVFRQIMDLQGFTEKTVNIMWGIYGGNRIIVNIPIAIASSLAVAVVPGITAALVKQLGSKDVHSKIGASIQLTMLIAFPSAVGIAVLAEPVSRIVLSSSYTEESVMLLVAAAVCIIFYSLSTITNAILQAINQMRLPMIHSAIGVVIHLVIFVLLVGPLKMELYGVVMSATVFPLIVCILNALALRKYMNYRQEVFKTFIVPAIASVVMGTVAFGLYETTYGFIRMNVIVTIFTILLSVLIYFAVIILLKGVDEETLLNMPKGQRVVHWCKKLKLMP